jgi:hypothetical protein
LLASVTLWDIRYGEHRLVNQVIALPNDQPPEPYLRLSWLSGADAVTLEEVRGVLRSRNELPPRRWVRAAYRPDQAQAGTMQFDSAGLFPVDQIDLQFSRSDSLVVGTVQSRDAERGVWQVHHRGAFYRLEMDNTTLHNNPVMVPQTTDRYWRLDIDPQQSRLGNSVPRLMLGWRPQEIFFPVERGRAYIVAYGSRKATPALPPPDLAARITASGPRIPLVAPGPRVELGGPSRLKGPGRSASGRLMSLSTLLLGCVLLLAFFIWWMVRRWLRVD